MFDYYISLGFSCPIASSMSKYGLRSFSGVFDWLITPNLNWVLHYIETDFKDFLLQENLERYDEQPNHFRDKQSNVQFMHDTVNFENQYSELKDKYNRQIHTFLEKMTDKVCFLRSVSGSKELEYIKNHSEYIRHVVQKHNPESEIVFLFYGNIPEPDNLGFRSYRLPVSPRNCSRRELRSYFNHADDFLAFCGENYSGFNLMKNLAFDFEKEEHLGTGLTERRYKTLTALLDHDFTKDHIPDPVIIYGAGIIGRELYKKIRSFTTIRCFVDREKAGSEFEGVKIISADEISFKDDVKIIVSAAYDFENIREKLSDKYPKEAIISLDDILNLKF